MTDPFALPEFTRGLRSFASPAALASGDAHERFFGPLLDARRIASNTERWGARLTAFDAERIEATMRVVLAGFAEERFPSSAPDRRAVTAQLEDACGGLFDALERLGAAAETVRARAGDETRALAWTAWVTAVKDVFGAADRGYEASRRVLDGTPAPDRRMDRARRRAGRRR